MMANTDQQEQRLGLSDVSDQISRVFFGKGVESGRPSYSDGYQPGYGAPQRPALYRGGLGRIYIIIWKMNDDNNVIFNLNPRLSR